MENAAREVAKARPSQIRAGAKEDVAAEFVAFVQDESFPCLGAKAAVNAGSFTISEYACLGAADNTAELADALRGFLQPAAGPAGDFATFIAIFRGPLDLDEERFESLLWSQLEILNRLDAPNNSWDPAVSSDPKDPHFSFSFAGHALYVIGMHGNSSRLARRFRWPTLVFNPHRQFERLRANGQWPRLRATIRARDLALQGSVNPMLRDFGHESEAAQYSGRATAEDWEAPFHPVPPKVAKAGGCPFHP